MDIKIKSFVEKLIPMRGWRSTSSDSLVSHVAGSEKKIDDILELILNFKNEFSSIEDLLRSEPYFFGYIIQGNDFIFASTDRIKSYPIFYGIDNNGKLFVSNCPYFIKNAADLKDIDPEAMLEFSMTSYTLGNKTLYQSLYQLQAGEYLFWNRAASQLTVHRYYRYLPRPDKTLSERILMEEHAHLMDRVIDRTIYKANGRPICVPLSGGLDSRIILTKLAEKKYAPLQAISYGIHGNFEARMAKQVAEELRVPWSFIPARPQLAKKLYDTQERFDYAKFSSALNTVPLYMEYEALKNLMAKNVITPDTMIINGQSGDFITGGHLPKLLYDKTDPTKSDFFQAAIAKHCSLWLPLLTEDNLNYIKKSITHSLPEADTDLSLKEKFLAQYESWEWQERQCKAVVKGQRLYDFYGYDWDLPLWDSELMDFWEKVPFHLKINQTLYVQYLQTYYPKLFQSLRPIAKPWVLKFKWIPVFAQFYGLLFGKDKKKDYYKRMYYYGTDYNQYALIGRKYYLAHYKKTHGLGPFLVSLTLDEWGILNDSKISDTKPIS